MKKPRLTWRGLQCSGYLDSDCFSPPQNGQADKAGAKQRQRAGLGDLRRTIRPGAWALIIGPLPELGHGPQSAQNSAKGVQIAGLGCGTREVHLVDEVAA